MKTRLKWYEPLQRWLPEAEHAAHVSVEPELRGIYASIMAEAVAPLAPPEARPEIEFMRLQALGGMQNVAGQYSLAESIGMQQSQAAFNFARGAQQSAILAAYAAPLSILSLFSR